MSIQPLGGPKKAFFGTLFDFTDLGVQEINYGLEKHFAGEDTVPVLSYDKKNRLFFCDVTTHDRDLVELVIAQIHARVTLHLTRTHDPLESDRMNAIDNTFLDDEGTIFRSREIRPDILLDTVDSSEDESYPAPINPDPLYWKPSCGDISILNQELAVEIADSTGTTPIPDIDDQRVKLIHGRPQDALEKLETVEQVLTLSARYRSKTPDIVNANLNLLQTGPDLVIKLTSPLQPYFQANRLMLTQSQHALVDTLLLGETRIWEGADRIKPLNLDLEGVYLTEKLGACNIFQVKSLPSIGDEKNKQVKSSPDRDSQVTRLNDFLGKNDALRVAEWRENVDPDGPPSLAPDEPQPDLVLGGPRKRVVIESSSEDESDSDVRNAGGKESKTGANAASQSPRLTDPKGKGKAPIVRQDMESELALGSSTPTSNNQLRFVQPFQHSEISSASKSHDSLYSGNVLDTVVDDHEHSEVASIANSNLITFDDSEDGNSRSKNRPRESRPTPQPQSGFNTPPESSAHDNSAVSSSRLPQHQISAQQIPATANSKQVQIRGPYQHGDKMIFDTVPTLPQPVRTHNISPSRSNKAGKSKIDTRQSHNLHGNKKPPAVKRRQDLVDLSIDDNSSSRPMPPPGFGYRTASSFVSSEPAVVTSPVQSLHGDLSPTSLLDSGSDIFPNIAKPAKILPPRTDYVPQYRVPKRNVNYHRNEMLNHLERHRTTRSVPGTSEEENTLPPNRIQANDEHSTRVYRKSMSQQMAKPGKSKKSNGKQETKAEKDARVAQAKADAYSDINPVKVQTLQSQVKPKPPPATEEISARKRRILKKSTLLAEIHPEAVRDGSNKSVAESLTKELGSILEATRAFKGVVKVEVQLGQALVIRERDLDEAILYTPRDYTKLLEKSKVTFTNIITSNGLDIDRLLDIKAENTSSRLWNSSEVIHPVATCQFSCQDTKGRDFMLVIDENGDHSLTRHPTTIGKIALHSPSQIWDACATVTGTMNVLRPSEDVLTAIEQFKASLYMPGGSRASVYYRRPTNRAFTVRAVMMRRVSTHGCLLSNRPSIKLRLTELKQLAQVTPTSDQTFFHFTETSFDNMVHENRLHYEVAIVDASIEQAFESNPGIEVGQLAPITTPSGTMLTLAQVSGLIDMTMYVLERIDWIGAWNNGTINRLLAKQDAARVTIINTLPVQLSRSLPIPMGSTAQPTIVQGPTTFRSHIMGHGDTITTTGASTIAPEKPVYRTLPGVRAGTAAELFQDPSSGQYFYLGYGGAKIPVVNETIDDQNIPGVHAPRSVVPDDSISQAGGLNSRSAGGRRAVPAKPPGFW